LGFFACIKSTAFEAQQPRQKSWQCLKARIPALLVGMRERIKDKSFSARRVRQRPWPSGGEDEACHRKNTLKKEEPAIPKG